MIRPTFLYLWLGLLLFSTCAPADHKTTQKQEKHAVHSQRHETDNTPHAHHQDLEAAIPSQESIYLLNSIWKSHHGKKMTLSELDGKPVVLAMVYASCTNACPRIIIDMKKIQTAREQEHPGQTRFVLISIDPEVDTPEKLAALAKKSKLNQEWLLLQGTPDNVMELAAVLGVKYRKISATDYAHSNLISVLNAKGEVIHRQMGLGVDPDTTLQALKQLNV